MKRNPARLFANFLTNVSADERNRRKRESIIIVVLIVIIGLLTFAEHRIIHFGTEFPVSSTILMFILININLLLLILLIFLVFRNLVKLFYDRKQNVMGAKLRTRLVVAFISLTLVPAVVLFFFSISFITTSIKFWFNVPVEKALNNSLQVGKSIYTHIENNNRFFLNRTAYQINKRNLLRPYKKDDLTRYIQIVQREFHLNAVEVYLANAKRLTYAVSQEIEKQPLDVISAGKLQKEPGQGKTISTITRRTPVGELVSSISYIPATSKAEEEAFLVISVLLPPDLTANLTTISKGFEEYQQIKLLQKPIQATYYIILSIVALLVVFCAVWFGFFLAKSITTPIMELAKGLEKVAGGDLNVNIEQQADDEIGLLVKAFNKMTSDLRVGRKQIEESAGMLAQQKDEIEARRVYMETVLDNISTGVISLDEDGYITTINKSAETMLSISQHAIVNRYYANVLGGKYLQLANEIVQQFTEAGENTRELPLQLTINGKSRSFVMYLNALRHDKTGQYMGVVMAVDDLTELERAQRMAAWREVARRIAHEVKNPLTPISLSAQRLQRKFARTTDDPVFAECIQTIIEYTEIIRNLVNEFANYAKFPAAKPALCELSPIIKETTSLYTEDNPDINFIIRTGADLPKLHLDRQQIKQALINLIENAISAMEGAGDIFITATYDAAAMKVILTFADTGKGVPDEEKSSLFEPYFSTKKSGMGLGLAIVNSIISDHNGKISAHDNLPRGVQFIIELPV